MQDPIIILGDSPFIETIQDKLLYALSRYYSIGINRIIIKYFTTYHAFTDLNLVHLTNKYKEIKTITLESYEDLVQKGHNKELFNSFSYNDKKKIFTKNGLAWCGFTHDYVISYCISKGMRNIVLVGASDFIDGGHCSCNKKFTYSEVLKEQSINFIEKECNKHALIRTLNPNSVLNIPRLTIDELLK